MFCHPPGRPATLQGNNFGMNEADFKDWVKRFRSLGFRVKGYIPLQGFEVARRRVQAFARLKVSGVLVWIGARRSFRPERLRVELCLLSCDGSVSSTTQAQALSKGPLAPSGDDLAAWIRTPAIGRFIHQHRILFRSARPRCGRRSACVCKSQSVIHSRPLAPPQYTSQGSSQPPCKLGLTSPKPLISMKLQALLSTCLS